jgi:hypothetical protein
MSARTNPAGVQLKEMVTLRDNAVDHRPRPFIPAAANASIRVAIECGRRAAALRPMKATVLIVEQGRCEETDELQTWGAALTPLQKERLG